MKSGFSKALIPSEENDYKPHVLQQFSMLVMALLVCFTFAAANLHALLWQASDWLVATVLPAVVVDLTNNERQRLNESPLVRNSVLDQAATAKAEHMAKNGYFSHYSPDGVSPWYWFDQAGYNYIHAGENLAIHFSDSGEVVEAWMKSPTHRANIVDDKFTEIGVGTAKGEYQGYETVYVVQLFGARVASVPTSPAIPVTPNTTEPVIAEVISEEADLEDSLTLAVDNSDSSTQVLSATDEVEESAEELVEKPVKETKVLEESAVEPINPKPDKLAMAETPKIEDLAVEENGGVSIYTTTVSSTRSAVYPVTPVIGSTIKKSEAGPLMHFLTQPKSWMQMTYVTLALLVIASLLLSIFIEIRHQRPVQVAYGFAMLFLMFVLGYVHVLLSSGATIV
ncbi:hypothetical protein KC723_00970 [Candidatus Kaiserbacteria bacterium]|nr:hypothetical protein [Candidatus Kaiserbacteria bacterium]